MKVTIQDSRTSVTVEPRDFRVTVSGARGPAGPAGANEWGEITGDIIDQTDLYNALEDKVPYTGATGDVNLGEHKLLFANASELREGTYDFGGQGGISQICSVGFENNWQSGFNHIFDNNGLIRESLHCFDIVPNSSFDSSLRFKIGSLWKLDDGTIYECVDATIGAAVWQLYNPYETDISGLVPYTGATADVNLGEYGAQLGNLEFDNTPTNVPTTAGSVYWSDTDGTLNMVLKGGQTISRIGETQHIRALNNTGAQIARGKVVYVVGAQGQRLTIALADADTEILSKDTIGFTSESIADGAEGFVIVQGVVNNISTTGMTDGATVYLSQTAGSYTTTPPADPAHLVILGFIVNGGSGGAGSIYVKVDNGYELEELHNVSNSAKTTPVADDALFLRDSADNNLWKRLTWTNALAGVKTHMDTFKSVSGGYASLDGSGKVPSSELPSYVDDVVEVANYAALPVTGETGKIYLAIDTNKCYRWSGTVYVQVAQGVDTLTTTGTSGAATLVGSTLNIPQYQSVLTNPVTGTGTAGQVSYWSGTGTQTGSSGLIYDASNVRLGINITPTRRLHVNGPSVLLQHNGNVELDLLNNTSITYLRLAANTTNTTIGTLQNIPFDIIINAITVARFDTSFNLGLGIGAATSSARLHVRGSGTTSSTTALLVQNNDATPARLMSVTDDGRIYIGSQSDTQAPYFAGYTGFAEFGATQRTLGIRTQFGSINRPQPGVLIGNSVNFDYTVNTGNYFTININFSPTSGTGVLNTSVIATTINQTGGANGITRGLYVNPTLTAAADWRSVEFSNNTGWGLYGAGTAANYLAGNTSIGTTTSSGRLTVQGSGTTSSTKALVVNNSTPTAMFEILDNGRISQTIPGAANNTIFGTGAGASASLSGASNSFFGGSAGENNTTGSSNSFFGVFSGLSNTSGASNSSFGFSAGQTNVSGGGNSFFGFQAGRFITSGSNLTNASNSIFIGYDTRANANSETNQIVIGYLAIGNGSNTATLGNTSITNTYLRGNINYTDGGNFVIGTTTGTKIGTATSQKIGLWNATPIVQPTTAVAAATRVGGGGTTVTDSDTFDGYTIAQLVKALRNMGALA